MVVSITRKNFGNVSAGVLFSKVAYQRNGDNLPIFCGGERAAIKQCESLCFGNLSVKQNTF